jgi:hypothetical protein
MQLSTDPRYTPSFSAYLLSLEPFREGGGSTLASWHYRRERGTWRVSVDVPNILWGEPYDGAMTGSAVCDDFGVLRLVGGLS